MVILLGLYIEIKIDFIESNKIKNRKQYISVKYLNTLNFSTIIFLSKCTKLTQFVYL